MNKQRFTFLQ